MKRPSRILATAFLLLASAPAVADSFTYVGSRDIDIEYEVPGYRGRMDRWVIELRNGKSISEETFARVTKIRPDLASSFHRGLLLPGGGEMIYTGRDVRLQYEVPGYRGRMDKWVIELRNGQGVSREAYENLVRIDPALRRNFAGRPAQQRRPPASAPARTEPSKLTQGRPAARPKPGSPVEDPKVAALSPGKRRELAEAQVAREIAGWQRPPTVEGRELMIETTLRDPRRMASLVDEYLKREGCVRDQLSDLIDSQ